MEYTIKHLIYKTAGVWSEFVLKYKILCISYDVYHLQAYSWINIKQGFTTNISNSFIWALNTSRYLFGSQNYSFTQQTNIPFMAKQQNV